MNTEISFTYRTDAAFGEVSKTVKEILDDAAKATLAYKKWWAIGHIGFLIIAVELENASDDTLKYYKPRRNWFKEKYFVKNPLHGDRKYDGYTVFEYGISQATYRAIVTSSPEMYTLLKDDFGTMIEKIKYLEKKVPNFDFAEFKRVFLEAIHSKIRELIPPK